MKKLSIKGLAKFILATSYSQRKILRDYKYPSEDEPRAKILYYRQARDIIVAYHTGDHGPDWLLEEARRLQDIAEFSTDQGKSRLDHNARALRAYARNFSDCSFEVLEEILLTLEFGDVLITVRPDLHVFEDGHERIIKLEFGKKEPPQRMVKIIIQGMFEASKIAEMGFRSSDVLFFDVPRGKRHKATQMGLMLRREIKAACRNIDAIWDSVEP